MYQKILRAAKRGTGLRLSAEEVAALALDSSIETVAWQDDEADERRRAGKETEACEHGIKADDDNWCAECSWGPATTQNRLAGEL
jgi:hypothetical protein